MKTSTERILTTHVGSIPRPENVRALLRARLGGQAIDQAELAARAAEAVTDVVRRQAQVALAVVPAGERSKTSFPAYPDTRPTGFIPTTAATDPSAALTGAGGAWARRVDSRREWRAFREYYTEYLPREMPLAAPPTVCQGPIAYKGQALLEKDLATFKAALRGAAVAEAFVPAIAPAMVGRGQNRYYKTEEEYVFAIAEALRTEYRAIVDAGFILQIDDPGLGETWDMLIPGVIAHTTAVVEHPETVAERLMTYARLVGRERVMAGVDCGFAQGALFQRQHPTIMWAKFEALVQGARLASARLWR